ncbi:MAG TPA: GerMN domain-containing protein, partial [Chloroflexota bacterium]|nr:GerMN domain-containing protein [Chloroflexota bacterium]
LHFPGRASDWGPRVKLLRLNIVNGVAMADFSKEMRAFDGGAARVTLLRQQITQTLKQFSTVKNVRISIEGQTAGIFEP